VLQVLWVTQQCLHTLTAISEVSMACKLNVLVLQACAVRHRTSCCGSAAAAVRRSVRRLGTPSWLLWHRHPVTLPSQVKGEQSACER
jgi:hypothetical protein